MVVWAVALAARSPGPGFSLKMQGGKTRNCPDMQIYKLYSIQIKEYSWAMKKEHTSDTVTTWMNLTELVLRLRNQTQMDILHDSIYVTVK